MRRRVAIVALVLSVAAPSMGARDQTSDTTLKGGAPPPRSAKTWVNKVAEIEEFMRTAPVVRMEPTPRGVTRSRRAFFAPGALVESIAWKPLAPGVRQGFFESYKSEVAAYEISKLIGLDMVPPKVERRIDGETGCAIFWASPTRSFADAGLPMPPPELLRPWLAQISRAMMFDNLVGNIDPNMGNWLVDPAWNLIIIDHSRALTTTQELPHRMLRVDAPLWKRMQALTAGRLKEVAGRWLGDAEIGAILDRRGRMQARIDERVREKGAAYVFGK